MDERLRSSGLRQADAMGVDPVRIVQNRGGSASTRDVLEHCTQWALREALRLGRLERVARGVVVLPGRPEPLRIAAELRGVVSHLSAAELYRLDMVNAPEAVHVTVPHGGSRSAPAGVVVHRTRHVEDDPRYPGRTPILRTVLDCATALPFADALAVADSALKYGLVTRSELLTGAARSSGPGRARRLRVATHADERAATAFESALRGILLEAGITTFVPQYEIRAGRLLLHADLADPSAGVVIEADSFEFHGGRADFRRDCERYDELVAAGWVVLRLPWELVMFDPPEVVRLVRAAMTGGRPGSSERTVPT